MVKPGYYKVKYSFNNDFYKQRCKLYTDNRGGLVEVIERKISIIYRTEKNKIRELSEKEFLDNFEIDKELNK
jgi:hypothetical protein